MHRDRRPLANADDPIDRDDVTAHAARDRRELSDAQVTLDDSALNTIPFPAGPRNASTLLLRLATSEDGQELAATRLSRTGLGAPVCVQTSST